ncbi:MAG: hypothetical protein NVSMB51_17450 [Solirubrobacteraceae bacterium]
MQSPTQRLWRVFLFLGVCVLGVGIWPAAARSETGAPAGTVQAVAADALFLQYAPPPPGGPGIVCLVDSGVNPNADTTPILAGSYALYPHTDTADEFSRADTPLDGHPSEHGTLMAELMAAPQNGYGIVGLAPTSVRVLNIKAVAPGQLVFPTSAYSAAMGACSSDAQQRPPAVITLSLGGSHAPSQTEELDVRDAVVHAHRFGTSVVAAAGNDGSQVLFPAAFPGVVAVGASDANPNSVGKLCALSARGPQLRVLAPGCDSDTTSGSGSGLDVAFSDGSPEVISGTSGSAALFAASLAALRAYAPELSFAEAESCFARTVTRGGNLDVGLAFHFCGLQRIVDEGTATAARRGPTVSKDVTPRIALPAPRILRVRVRRNSVRVSLTSIPSGTVAVVTAARTRLHKRFVVVSRTTGRSNPLILRAMGWNIIRAHFVRGSLRSPTSVFWRQRA